MKRWRDQTRWAFKWAVLKVQLQAPEQERSVSWLLLLTGNLDKQTPEPDNVTKANVMSAKTTRDTSVKTIHMLTMYDVDRLNLNLKCP